MERVLIVGMHDTIGGVETFLMNYYRNIDKTKIQFDFINMFDNLCFENEIIAYGGKIYKVANVKKNPLRYYKEVKKIIKENGYKIVHVNMLSMANILPIIVAKKERVERIILHSHNTSTPHGVIRKILNIVNKRYAIKHATDLVACSEYAGNWMFGENREFTVIKNAIDSTKYKYNNEIREKIRSELNVSSNYVIGHVGRFAEQKNHKFLIEIFKEVAEKENNAKLLLIGEGDLKEEIRRDVERLNLTDKVIFLDPVENVNDYYQSMDIFVLPSLFEGLPVVGIEAQTSGLKCIFSKKITQELQIIDRVSFLDIDNPKVWGEAIIKEMEDYDRNLKNEEIQKSGYDIRSEALKLQDFYLKK